MPQITDQKSIKNQTKLKTSFSFFQINLKFLQIRLLQIITKFKTA